MNKLFRFLISVAVAGFFLAACSNPVIQIQSVGPSAADPMLKPGDRINDMVLTTGADEAAPLWAFCLPTVESDRLITVDCPALSYPRLAIGHTFGVMDLVPRASDWSELTWELYLDEYPVDLAAFGTHDFIHPDLAPNPSPIREVFRKVTVWDIVLTNPTPGVHTLRGLARTETMTYTWTVNFSIETPSGT